MEATLNVADLKTGLRTTKASVAKRGRSFASLSGVKLTATTSGGLRLQTTDLDVTCQTNIPASVVGEGAALVSHAELTKLIKGKGLVTLRSEDDEQLAVVNGITTTLRQLPIDELPRDPAVGETESNVFPLDLDALAGVIPAASKDDARPIMTGVYFDGTDIVATDSYRLHAARGPVEVPRLNLPARVLAEVVRHGKPADLIVETVKELRTRQVEILAEDATDEDECREIPNDRPYPAYGPTPAPTKHYYRTEPFEEVTHQIKIVAEGSTTWFVREIEGDYPNWRQLFPSSYPNRLTVNAKALKELVAQVSPMAKDATPVRLATKRIGTEATVEVSARTQDVGTASGSIAAEFDGEELTVAYNPKFLIVTLSVTLSEDVAICTLDALKPALIQDVDPNGWPNARLRRLLMPVRVT